ncbi:MAG: hypothetical protein HZA48_02945 [Planctomycetes bacterium]|nr:hypothetical protein [Planctomycetota bacterium]
MNENQIQACLQLLKDVPEEPDWPGFENAVMKSISIVGRKNLPAGHYTFLPAVLAAICLVFWAVLASGITGGLPQNAKNTERLTVLNVQEQRIVTEHPEITRLLHDIKPVKSGRDLNGFMAERYSFLEGGY